jgi:putative Holliday junction resolvase
VLYCFKINCHVVIKYDGKLSLKYKIYNMITIEDFKIKHSNKVRFIGLDLGSKRIGVSICDERQSIATPFKTINKTNTSQLIDELKMIIKENNIGGIIVGNPINMDGSLGRSAQSVNDVASNISKSIDLPVILWDERLSTVGAFNLSSLLDVNVSKRVKTIDQNAAAFILQGAIDFLNN